MILLKKNIASLSFITILLVGIISFLLVKEFTWKGEDDKGYTRIIRGDGLGYYMYLPNLFINQSISNQEINNRQILGYKNRGINKYYVGTAVAMSPFFVWGYAIASIQKDKLDGYSPPFQKAISMAAIFYLLLGLFFIKRLLELYQIKDGIIAFSLVLIIFGTNLITYIVVSPSMSHVYSFGMVSAFLYFSKKYFTHHKKSNFYFSSFLLAMVILIRPIDGLIIFALPFLAGSWEKLKNAIINIWNFKNIIISLFVFCSIVFIQPYMNFLQTGDFWVWNYQNEGFYFSNPQIWSILFSFRKGWFIYTPIAFISFIGLFYLIKQNKFAYTSLLFFFFILIYITSSWWNWFYGPSFSQRPFVDFYALNAVLIALFISSINSKILKTNLIGINIILIILNLIQSYQYDQRIISTWDMNFEKYKYTFLKTSPEYIKCLGGNNDIWLYNDNRKKVISISNDFEKEYPFTSTGKYGFDEIKQTKVCDYSNTEFNTTVQVQMDSSYLSPRGLFAEVSLDCMQLEELSSNDAFFVVDVTNNKGENYHYYAFKINDVPSKKINKWKTLKYTIEITTIKNIGDKITFYVWNRGMKPFYIDNLKVDIYTVN